MASSPLRDRGPNKAKTVAAPRQITADDLPDKFDELLTAATTTRKETPKENFEKLVGELSSYANTNGLTHGYLETLLRILTLPKTSIDASKTRTLVKSLVPLERVKPSTVIHLISSLGEGEQRAEYAAQALLLNWLVMVYDFLDSYAVLHQLYGILFNFLYTANLRAPTCHLLALCTRRKDVKPFRIQALLKLYEDHSDESGVVGLLRVYQSFYPDVILNGSRKRSVFKVWDPLWVQNTTLIQSRREETPDVEDADRELHRRRSTRILSKSKKAIVPVLHTFNASENSVTLEEIDSIRGLVDNLQKLELPSQVGAVFQDDMFRNFVLLKGSDDTTSRLDDWTYAALFDEYDVEIAVKSASERLEVFLKQILDYTTMRKALLPSVEDFLKEYVKTWNGKWHREAILGLLSFVPFSSHKDLKEVYFDKLESILQNDSSEDVAALIHFHTSLAHNFIITHSTSQHEALDPELRVSIRQYFNYVDQLNSQSIINHRSQASIITILYAALDFYETIVKIPLTNPVFEVVYPADIVVYSSVFVGDAVSFSRTCGTLADYKKAFLGHAELRSKNPDVGYIEPERVYVDHFNGFLMDISNFFWRARCFYHDPAKDTNALGCLMKDDFVEYLNAAANSREFTLNGLFTLTHSPTFSRFNTDCLRFLEERYEDTHDVVFTTRHAGPVTSKSLMGLAGDGGYSLDYRVFKVASLEYLKRKGFDGVHRLIYSTMKKLKDEATKYNVEGMFEGLEEWSFLGSEDVSGL
ncbi:uncharacterized protein DFL_007692 [Arthrobotrys flagrans]|uniref:Mis6 domain protein n=1 Tax=Arthrobotrys flagrans TaxID=97331 RepID=A0A436ZWD8_ARTFL|nr:hypothetical protein DFL_007692 [Arthrobotrys flagrans]